MTDDWKTWKVVPDDPPKKKKLPVKAPTKLFGLPNPDKQDHDPGYDKMQPGENLARFPGPFRCCIIGRVNSGKSLVAKFILMAHQAKRPMFKEVFVVHGMANTEEYKDIEPTELMTEIPSYDEFEKDGKKIMIIDDYDFTSITRAEKTRLSELFRFGSSHQNLSIMLLHQSFFRVPKIVKDCCSIFIIYRPVDKDELATIGRRVGLKKEQIQWIFDTYMPHFKDNLTVNLLPNAPHKFVKNLYEPLDIDFKNCV